MPAVPSGQNFPPPLPAAIPAADSVSAPPSLACFHSHCGWQPHAAYRPPWRLEAPCRLTCQVMII